MALTVKCPNPQCGKSYSVAEESLGRRVKCASCGAAFTLKMSLDETAQPRSRQEPQPSPVVKSPARVPDSSSPPSGPTVSPVVHASDPAKIGPYLVRRKLGSGAMGEVWLAHDPTLERDVAIKVLPTALADDAERLQRFLREARAAAQLDHPNTAFLTEDRPVVLLLKDRCQDRKSEVRSLAARCLAYLESYHAVIAELADEKQRAHWASDFDVLRRITQKTNSYRPEASRSQRKSSLGLWQSLLQKGGIAYATSPSPTSTEE